MHSFAVFANFPKSPHSSISQSRGVMNFEDQPSLELEEQRILIDRLTPYGFSARLDQQVGANADGTLLIGNESFKIQFRVRDQDRFAACSFVNLTIANKNKIRKFLADQQRRRQGRVALRSAMEEGLARESIDVSANQDASTTSVSASAPLLSGGSRAGFSAPVATSAVSTATVSTVTSADRFRSAGSATSAASVAEQGTQTESAQSESAQAESVAEPVSSGTATLRSSRLPATTEGGAGRGGVKVMSMLLMLLAMIALVVAAVYWMPSRSSLAIENSALVGSSLPVYAKIAGEVVELNVVEGQVVKKGDLLLQIRNLELEATQKNAEARLATADIKVLELEKQLMSCQARMKVAKEKFSLDLEAATSQQALANKSLDAARATVKRLRPFVESGSVTQAEFDVAVKEELAAEAKRTAVQSQLKLVVLSKAAASKGILVAGDRIEDEMARLVSEIEIAEAQVKELTIAKMLSEQAFSKLKIRAPRDGRVEAIHREVGDYLQVADETVSIGFDGELWAVGEVAVGLASRVRPGQSVLVEIQATGLKYSGVVVSVGDRATNLGDGYAGGSRVAMAATVPVKVMIQDLPENLHSGTRLQMAIDTGFGIQWLDETMGYQRKPLMGDGADVLTPTAGETSGVNEVGAETSSESKTSG